MHPTSARPRSWLLRWPKAAPGCGDQVTVVAGTGGYTARAEAGRSPSAANPRLDRLWTPSLGRGTAFRRSLDYAVFFVQACCRLLTLPPQDAILLMTTPPFLAVAGLVHRLRNRRVRLIVWSMDCYPETLEQAGMIRVGGRIAAAMRALNRWLYRRLDSVVCLDDAMRRLLEHAYAPGGHPRLVVIPNWEPAARFPAGGRPPDLGGSGPTRIEGQAGRAVPWERRRRASLRYCDSGGTAAARSGARFRVRRGRIGLARSASRPRTPVARPT